MAYDVVWSELAVQRMEEICEYIAQTSPEAAAHLVEEIFERSACLADHPQIDRPYPGAPEPNLRELLVSKYRVIYELRAEQQQVWILTVRHQRRQPLYPENI